MQNAEGEVTVRKNKVFFNGKLIGEFHFKDNQTNKEVKRM